MTYLSFIIVKTSEYNQQIVNLQKFENNDA